MGKDINIELKEQNVMLDAVEKDIDKEGEKMEDLLAGLTKLLKSKDGCQIGTIVALVVVLIILSKFVVLYQCKSRSLITIIIIVFGMDF